MIKIFKILICDDQSLIRESLAIVLEKNPELKVIGMASNGKEAVELVEKLKPKLILMDIKMPVMDGIEATKIIHEKLPNVKIVALTTFEDDELIVNCVASGAIGYILKDITASDLIKAIQLIRNGTTIFPASFTKNIANIKSNQTKTPKQDFRLTQREHEILRCLFEGMSNREMAKRLFISETTVKNHLTSIFTKLKAKNRTQAILIALRNQLINEEGK